MSSNEDVDNSMSVAVVTSSDDFMDDCTGATVLELSCEVTSLETTRDVSNNAIADVGRSELTGRDVPVLRDGKFDADDNESKSVVSKNSTVAVSNSRLVDDVTVTKSIVVGTFVDRLDGVGDNVRTRGCVVLSWDDKESELLVFKKLNIIFVAVLSSVLGVGCKLDIETTGRVRVSMVSKGIRTVAISAVGKIISILGATVD